MRVVPAWVLPAANLGLLAFFVFGITPPSSAAGYYGFSILVALAFLLLGLVSAKSFQVLPDKKADVSLTTILLVAATMVVLGASVLRLGMTQFGGFDHSALIDMGFRLYHGQQPFKDFPCSMPPLFYLGAWAAFLWFGVSWGSLVLLTALGTALSFAWSFGLCAFLLRNPAMAWVYAFSIQICTFVLVSYWWYNPLTTVTASLFFLSAIALCREKVNFWCGVSWSLSAALLALCKPNVAGLLLVGIIAVLLFSAYRRQMMLPILGAMLSLVLFFLFLKLDPREILFGYLGIARRGFSLNQLFQDLPKNEAWVFTGLLLLLLIPWFLDFSTPMKRIKNREVLISMVALIAGLYGFMTNGEAKPVDLPLLVLATAFGPILHLQKTASSDPKSRFKRVVAERMWIGLLCLLLGVACAQAVTRHRVELIGPGLFFEFKIANGEFLPKFFHGLRAGENLNQTCKDVGDLLNTAPEKNIYFGPRMQWAYAAYGITPPIGHPSWWHPGVSFPTKDEPMYLNQWFAQEFDLAIFLKNDFTYMPVAFVQAMADRYAVDQSYAFLTVFRHK